MTAISKTNNDILDDSRTTEGGPMFMEMIELLNDVSESSLNLQALKTALHRMESFLSNLSLIPETYGKHNHDNEMKVKDKKKHQGHTGHEVNEIRNHVASSLLRLDRVVTTSSTNIKIISMSSSMIERDIFSILEKCLDLCGTKTILLASNQCLMEASQSESSSFSLSIPETQQLIPPSCVLLSIRTLKRILLPQPLSYLSTTKVSLNSNRKNSDINMEWSKSIQSLLYLAQSISIIPSNSSKNSSLISVRTKPNFLNTTTKDEIDNLARIIVMLPIRIASALHASKLSSSLPSWATRTNYFPRIIHILFVSTLFCYPITTIMSDLNNASTEKEQSDHNLFPNNDKSTKCTECIEMLLKSVLKLILRHGGADDIALGSFNTYLLLKANHYNLDKINPVNRNNVEHTSDHLHNFNHLLSQCIIQLTTPKESAHLLRSFLLCISAFCLESLHHPPKGSTDTIALATDYFFQNQKSEQKQRKLSQDQQKEKFKMMIPYLDIFCLPILQASPEIRDAMIQSLILSPALADCIDVTISWSVAHLLYKCTYSFDVMKESNYHMQMNTEIKQSSDIAFPSCLQEVSEIWSQSTFINHTDLTPQKHVTNFILKGLSLLNSHKKSDNHDHYDEIIEILVRGVTVRLESSILEVRKHGMRVAESFAVLVGQPLSFEELRKQEETETIKQLNSDVMLENCHIDKSVMMQSQDHKIDSNNKSRRPQRKMKQKKLTDRMPAFDVDPDDEFISDEESYASSNASSNASLNSDSDGEGSIWDSSVNDEEDEFVPFDLTDNEQDLIAVPAPCFLNECLSMLRSPESDKETYDRHHISLKTLPGLLKSHPPDLPDLAIPLTNDILHLENKFDMPNFEAMRMECLTRLIISEPLLLGEYLVKEKMFEDGQSLSTRLEVLDILGAMSEELCGSEELKKMRENQNLRLIDKNKPKVSGKRRLVKEESATAESNHTQITSLESRTRRWGRLNIKSNVKTTVTNRFGPIGPLIFYGLLAKFNESKEKTNIWEGPNGVHLISKFIITLSTIVQSSGFYPGTSILASELYVFVWSFIDAESAEVRQAVLYSLAVCIPFLPDNMLIEMIQKDQGLISYLEIAITEDTDPQCRKLAIAILSILTETTGLSSTIARSYNIIQEL